MAHETAREDVSMDDEVPEVHSPESPKETSEKASPIPSPEDEAVSPEVETPRAEVASPDKTLSQTPTPRNTAPSPDAEEKVMTPAAETDEAESPRKSPSPVMETAQPSNEPSVEPEESRSNGGCYSYCATHSRTLMLYRRQTQGVRRRSPAIGICSGQETCS